MAGHAGPADPYQVLGVTADANREEIVRAYHRQVRDSHPDLRGGDAAAQDRFRAVTDAYQLLGDPGRRMRYDRAHPRPGPGPAPGAEPGPGPVSGRPRRPRPGPPPIWAGPVHVEPPAGQPGHPVPQPGWPGHGQQEIDVAGVPWLVWYRVGPDRGSWWA